MSEHVIIDGNNLLHAMHACAPIPTVGRETLTRVVERWAGRGTDEVTLIFDGPVPREGLAKQMMSKRITVCFSAPKTADDLIVAMVHRASNPGAVRVVSGDTAIRREARHRRCRHTEAVAFVSELFPPESRRSLEPRTRREKPESISPDDTRKWLKRFGYDDSDLDLPDQNDVTRQ